MAISAPTVSREYLAQTGSPFTPGKSGVAVGLALYKLEGSIIFTAAGFTSAAAGDLALLRLPPGRIRIYLELCRLTCPAGTVNSDLDIGLGAYTKTSDRSTQALQGSLLADSLDVGGGALAQNLPGNPAATSIVVDSVEGVDVVASFDTANSPSSGVLRLVIVYAPEAA